MPRAIMQTPFGPISIRWDADAVLGIELAPGLDLGGANPDTPTLRCVTEPSLANPETRLQDAIIQQLSDYLESRATGFALPVRLQGTAFQRRVWSALTDIGFGQTRTYGELARRLATSPRAVGQACRANPCPILIPCHRVVAANGLGGFAGDRGGRKLAVKRWLLGHEGWVEGTDSRPAPTTIPVTEEAP